MNMVIDVMALVVGVVVMLLVVGRLAGKNSGAYHPPPAASGHDVGHLVATVGSMRGYAAGSESGACGASSPGGAGGGDCGASSL